MRRLLFALPILIAIGLLVATWRGNAPAPATVNAAAETRPRYEVADARWVRYNAQGQPEFEANIEAIEYFDDESARLRSVEMHSLGGTSSPWRINAPEGLAPAHSQRRVQLTGGVSATRQSDDETVTFNAPYLWVDESNKVVYTDAPVQIRGRGRSASAAGMRADWIGKNVELIGQVQTQYAMPD